MYYKCAQPIGRSLGKVFYAILIKFIGSTYLDDNETTKKVPIFFKCIICPRHIQLTFSIILLHFLLMMKPENSKTLTHTCQTLSPVEKNQFAVLAEMDQCHLLNLYSVYTVASTKTKQKKDHKSLGEKTFEGGKDSLHFIRMSLQQSWLPLGNETYFYCETCSRRQVLSPHI